MPPIPVGRHYVEWLWKLGPAIPNGMGMSPIHVDRINPWAEAMGYDLLPRDVDLLIRLSADFVAESNAATKANAEEPWDTRERIRATELQRAELKKD